MTSPDNDRIYGWKSIAEYLLRDERTAKRWEKQRGLPVRRIPGEGRANVYVQRSEVEAWLRQGAATAAEGGAVPEQGAAAEESAAGASAQVPGEPESAVLAKEDTPAEESGAEDPGPGDGMPGEALPGQAAATAGFRPSEHISLLVSGFGFLLLLAATAARFFHVGPLESILFASESAQPVATELAAMQDRDELYLRAMYLCEQRSPAALEEAEGLFRKAIAGDPQYAASYTGLAKTYLLEREYATKPDAEAYQKAREAAETALRLNPHQAEAHAILGFVEFFRGWDAAGAEREFHLAIDTDGANVLAHHWFGSMLMHQGRYKEALSELGIAQRLNPTSTAILASKALTIGFSGQKETGVRLLETMERDGKETSVVHRDLSYLSLIAPRDPARFLEEAQRFAELRQNAQRVPLLREAREALDRKGEAGMWEALLRGERVTHPDDSRPSYLMAEAEAALGQDGAALNHLAKLADARDASVQGMMLEPPFLPLHNNAEFTRIATEAGLVNPIVAMR